VVLSKEKVQHSPIRAISNAAVLVEGRGGLKGRPADAVVQSLEYDINRKILQGI
jgi:hypothetical protein